MDFLLALHQLVLPKLRAGNSSLDGTNLAQATISICYKNMCVPFGICDLDIWDLGFGIWILEFGIWNFGIGKTSLDGTNLAQATNSICYKNMCAIWK